MTKQPSPAPEPKSQETLTPREARILGQRPKPPPPSPAVPPPDKG